MGAIKCFGDFWSREQIKWTPGKEGRKLLGHRGKEIVNFRRQIGIYALFTASREIIYIGQAGRGEKNFLFGRLRDHTIDRLRHRWEYFSWFGVREVDHENRDLSVADPIVQDLKPYEPRSTETVGSVLDELEGILIHLLEPRLNRQGPRWDDASEYFQGLPAYNGDYLGD